MEMVSAAKLKRFQKLLDQTTPYARALKTARKYSGIFFSCHHPLLAEREENNAPS